jgi:hypothetical protein
VQVAELAPVAGPFEAGEGGGVTESQVRALYDLDEQMSYVVSRSGPRGLPVFEAAAVATIARVLSAKSTIARVRLDALATTTQLADGVWLVDRCEVGEPVALASDDAWSWLKQAGATPKQVAKLRDAVGVVASKRAARRGDAARSKAKLQKPVKARGKAKRPKPKSKPKPKSRPKPKPRRKA